MKTHSIQFAQPGNHPGHLHSLMMPRRTKVGTHFAMIQPKAEGDEQHQELVKETEKWVSQTFYGELLKQMRNSPFKDKIFSGGRGGEAFGEMLDQKLADKMSKGAGHQLVEAIVNKIEKGRAQGHSAHLFNSHKAKRPQPSQSLLYRLRGTVHG